MKRYVLDASVVVKWFFSETPREHDAPKALELLHAIKTEEVSLVQPPHWLAEAAAVISRLNSTIAPEAVNLLYAMEFPISDSLEVYQIATELSQNIPHHLFDTIYHAVALSLEDTHLITADMQYFRKAKFYGSILSLRDLVLV